MHAARQIQGQHAGHWHINVAPSIITGQHKPLGRAAVKGIGHASMPGVEEFPGMETFSANPWKVLAHWEVTSSMPVPGCSTQHVAGVRDLGHGVGSVGASLGTRVKHPGAA